MFRPVLHIRKGKRDNLRVIFHITPLKYTLMCLSIGTPKIINFPFVPNGKFITLKCPKIRANYSLIIMCSNIGTPNNHHFLFGTNGKVVVLGVPILKHFRVCCDPSLEPSCRDGFNEGSQHIF